MFVLIDKENNGLVPIEYFGLIVSSNISKNKYKHNELLKKDELNGLTVNSIVKCDVLYSISQKNILFKIGTIDIDDYVRFINSYSNSNNFNKEIINN